MSHDQHETNGSTPSGTEDQRWSRRHALKAGVGVGVAAAAWTGPSITSLGATPAYASGCTFAVEIVVASDRNTDQRSDCNLALGGGLGYHEVATLSNLPSGYENTPSGWNAGVCSTTLDPYKMTLTYPSGLHCAIEVEFWNQNNKSRIWTVTFDAITEDGGTTTLNWQLPTATQVVAAAASEGVTITNWSNVFYRVVLRCVTPGLEDCFRQ